MHAEPGKWIASDGGEGCGGADVASDAATESGAGEAGEPLMADTHLYLFDSAGKCRKRYSIDDADEMGQLVTDAKAQARKYATSRWGKVPSRTIQDSTQEQCDAECDEPRCCWWRRMSASNRKVSGRMLG